MKQTYQKRFSNDWKLFPRFFQSLETFSAVFPTIGNFWNDFSNDWKSASGVFLLLVTGVQAVPLSSFRYYGQVVDEAGAPYQLADEAMLLVKADGREVSRCPLYPQYPKGCNFVVSVALDSENDSYREYAVRPGTEIEFAMIENGGECVLSSFDAIPAVGNPGKTAAVHLFLGTDSDGDGLSDAYEQNIIDDSSGLYDSLADINGDDDLDGDGFTNAEEFCAGTDPLRKTDFFAATGTGMTNGCICIEFPTVAGKAYKLFGASALCDGGFIWSAAPCALSPGGVFAVQTFSGVDGMLTLYVPLGAELGVFKLTVE